MKCENCGKNEVTFMLRSNVNGKVTERHLCSECAEKLGYTQRIMARSQRMMENFFGGGFLQDFFSPMPGLLGGMDRFFGEDPFDDFFEQMPALGTAPAEQPAEKAGEKEEALVDQEEQNAPAQRAADGAEKGGPSGEFRARRGAERSDPGAGEREEGKQVSLSGLKGR